MVKQVDEVAAVLFCGVDLAEERVFEADGSFEDSREVLAGHVDDVAFYADTGAKYSTTSSSKPALR